MQIINEKTLYLSYNGERTFIQKDTNFYQLRGNVVNKILNYSCIYYGSSLKGRLMCSKNVLNTQNRLPIVISEQKQIVMFPIKENNNILWLNFKLIKDYVKEDDGVKITFKNEVVKNFNISYTILNNQMLKCSKLLLTYLLRS